MNRVFAIRAFGVVLSFSLCVVAVAALFEGALRFGIIENTQYDRRESQKDAKYKLLIIGDSFIAPRTLVAKSLARELASKDFSVFNAAISGGGPFEYVSEMRDVGLHFQPDIVLLSYYVGNDLTNVQNHPRFNPNKTGVGIDSRTSQSYGRSLYLYHYILRSLRAVNLRFRAFDYEKAKAAGIAEELIEDAKNLRINPWLLNVALEDKNYLLDNILMETSENKKSWTKVKQLLAEVHDICNSLHSQLIIVIFPASIQVNDSHFEFYKKLTFNLDVRTVESTKPQRLLMEFCVDRYIPCLDLLPVFKARKDEEFYRNKDDHLNEKGNYIARQLIQDFVLKHRVGPYEN